MGARPSPLSEEGDHVAEDALDALETLGSRHAVSVRELHTHGGPRQTLVLINTSIQFERRCLRTG